MLASLSEGNTRTVAQIQHPVQVLLGTRAEAKLTSHKQRSSSSRRRYPSLANEWLQGLVPPARCLTSTQQKMGTDPYCPIFLGTAGVSAPCEPFEGKTRLSHGSDCSPSLQSLRKVIQAASILSMPEESSSAKSC